jgi:hypothetical protein
MIARVRIPSPAPINQPLKLAGYGVSCWCEAGQHGLAERLRARLKPAKQDQDQQDDNHDAQSAAAIVAGPIKWTATKPAKTSKQEDDQDYYQYGSDRHQMTPK